MKQLVLFVSLAFSVWLIWRDSKRRTGMSSALWLPTLWVGVLASRPFSMWSGWGGGSDAMEGSPLDRLFYLGIIVMSWLVIAKRRVNWGLTISRNWALFLFYGYLLVSVLWAEDAIVSSKRWFKEFGNIVVALVILTEAKPLEAMRVVFIRVAVVMLPLSVVFIRYFPDLGRRYSVHGGLQNVGVSVQKNTLGLLVLISGLMLVWEWLERTPEQTRRLNFIERYMPHWLLLIGAYLLYTSDSKTSTLCLGFGAGLLAVAQLPIIRSKMSALGALSLGAAIVFAAIDSAFGITQMVVASIGRDMTFTGRTDIWAELLKVGTDPLVGVGFCSFWTDTAYLVKLPPWIGGAAHNGYLEIYIDGGWVGVTLLAVLLANLGLKLNRRLSTGDNYDLVRFGVFCVTVVVALSESIFARMTSLGFMFLLTALDPSVYGINRQTAESLPRMDDATESTEPVQLDR